jgi:hypothetical protein
MTIEFQYCGQIDKDSREKAFSIAADADTVEEAWAMVDALDSASCEAICASGIFLGPSVADINRAKAREICEDNALVIEWSNDAKAEIDEDGDIYFNGRYASEEEMRDFIQWVEEQA